MKKLLCLLLTCFLLLTVLPVFAASSDVTVSFTVTRGEGLYAVDGVMLAQQTLTVPYFDLARYGLQDYYYNPACYTAAAQQPGTAQTADGVVTLLHALLYATEVYRCGLAPADAGQGFLRDSGMLDDELSLSGKAGSSYMTLWDLGTNFNYFVNRAMPLGREGWMATSDQIALYDGDSVRVHALTGSAGGTNLRCFRIGSAYDAAAVEEGADVTLTLLHRGTDLVTGTSSESHLALEAVYCTAVDTTAIDVRTWRKIGTTDANGCLTFSSSALGAGTYWIATAGSFDSAHGMQNAPAVFRLMVGGSVAPAEKVPVVIEGFHEMQLCSAKLFTETDGVTGTRDLLSGAALSDDMRYTLSLAPGDYRAAGYDANGRFNGSVRLRVSADSGNTFRLQRAYAIYAQNSGWVQDTDYAVYVSVMSADGAVNRHAVTGTADNYGTLRTSCLFLEGDTVTARFVPLGDKAQSFLPAVLSKTCRYNTDLHASLYSAIDCTFTAPAGSVIDAGRFSDYYVYDFYTPSSRTTLPDGRVQTVFRLPGERVSATGSPNFFCRVQNPRGVTYWNFFDPAASLQTEITAEQLFLDDAQVNAHTVLHHYEYNTYDTANIYLNGNAAGCISLSVGDTFELNAFRNWMAIENFYNAKVALPDMHYRVIDENGNDSDLLTVTPDPHNSSSAKITANGSGTAILLVTYDAMFSNQAYRSGKANQPNLFSAIWPENTGVLVFSVGADGAVKTNMFLNGTGEGNALDAEHDPLFYTGDGGASYTFTPESGCAVTVNRPIVTDTMTFAGFTSEGVTRNADGSVTLTGLLHGRNIVRIEKNGRVTYQVVTAKQISYVLLDADGAPLADDAVLHAGDTVQIQYIGLANPVEKMSGVYNHNARIVFTGEDGTQFSSVAGGAWGVYDFGGNPERQRLTVTIPRYWTGESYTLTGGAIAMRISGSAAGSHRGVSYGRGMDPNFHAGTSGSTQGSIPDVTLRLAQTTFYTARMCLTDADGKAVDPALLTIKMTDADGVEVPVDADGAFSALPGHYTVTVSGKAFYDASTAFDVKEDGETFVCVLQRRPVLALDAAALTVRYKSTAHLTATRDVVWSSSDETVATVDETGTVTAVGKGTAEIQALDDETGDTVVCTITVKYAWWQWLIRIFLFGFLWY